MLELLINPNAWASLLTLTVMEIVLGIDNIVFISVLTAKLPAEQAKRARQIGLAMALVFRIVLLMALSWLIGLIAPLFSIGGYTVTWRDLILIAGGLFLLYKATHEIHQGMEGDPEDQNPKPGGKAMSGIIAQIIVIDLVFSVDSIITAIGMAEHIEVMVLAVIIAVAVMYVAANPISHFIHEHPTTKMLALSFLMLVGAALVADGAGFHIPRAFIYSAMAFSALVEVLNIRAKTKRAAKKAANQAEH
jgi:predicted tellurium resistance membrane protein TerC